MQNQLRYEIEKFKQLTIFNGFHGTLAIGYCLCLSHSSCVSVANCCQYPNILNLNDWGCVYCALKLVQFRYYNTYNIRNMCVILNRMYSQRKYLKKKFSGYCCLMEKTHLSFLHESRILYITCMYFLVFTLFSLSLEERIYFVVLRKNIKFVESWWEYYEKETFKMISVTNI